jgi:hypothetical protein
LAIHFWGETTMRTSHCSSVVLFGAVLALSSACGKTKEGSVVAAAAASTPNVECKPATVDNLVGPTWQVDEATCEEGCVHPHVAEGHAYTFTKDGANFDIHGSYETSGGALEPHPTLPNEVRGKIRVSHVQGGETEHWLTAHLYVDDDSRCGKPNPYDLKIAVCDDMPISYDACKRNEQHGGYAHSHP